jgi:hypothetical protein
MSDLPEELPVQPVPLTPAELLRKLLESESDCI